MYVVSAAGDADDRRVGTAGPPTPPPSASGGSSPEHCPHGCQRPVTHTSAAEAALDAKMFGKTRLPSHSPLTAVLSLSVAVSLVSGDYLHLMRNCSAEAALDEAGWDLGQPLRVAAIHDPPYFSVLRRPDGSCCRYDGYLLELWQLLARRTGLQYEISPLTEGGLGRLDENGTWTGLVGALADGRADVALSWLGTFGGRQQVVAFLDAVPVSVSRERFYVRRRAVGTPRLTAAVADTLLAPLGPDVWWTLLAALLLLAAALRVSVRLNHADAEAPHTVAELGWGSCLMACFGTVVRQGWAAVPDSLAARTVFISCWALSTIISASYTANLMSQLAVEHEPTPTISSLSQFLEQSDWTFGIERGHGVLTEWAAGGDPQLRALSVRAERRDRYTDLSALEGAPGLDQVLLYSDLHRLRMVVGAASCPLVALPDRVPVHRAPGYLAVTRRLPGLQTRLNAALLAAAESGLLQGLRRRWLTSAEYRCQSAAEVRGLSLSDLLAVVLLVPLAVLLSGALVGLERLWLSVRHLAARDGCLLPSAGHRRPVVAWSPNY